MSGARSEPRAVGAPRARLDSRAKVTGRARYAADLAVPGTLHARVVPSVYAHARLRRIDASRALAMPGVVAVLTAPDLPIVGWEDRREFDPLARTEVMFAGQPVALVIAESESAAEDAVDLVEVDAEPLEPVTDAVAAARPDAPLALALPRPGSDGAFAGTSNVIGHNEHRRGDPDAAESRSDVVVSSTFRTSWVYQGYLEPQAAVAWVEADGTLAVTSATQGTFYTRDHLATLFGLPSAKVRVAGASLGGGFGGKLMIIEPLVAAAALRLGRPVRLVLTRREDMKLNSPAQGGTVELRLGARRTGAFELLHARAVLDAGAYPDWSFEWHVASTLAGPYHWPALDVDAVGVRTNRFAAGSYRAPMGPQMAFAVESLIDELARRLEIDPIAIRRANLAREGDPRPSGDPWPATGAGICLDRAEEHPLWRARGTLPHGEGVGIALGCWAPWAAPAAATCRLEPDGTLTVITGVVDVTGSTTSLALIAAETFGLDPSAVTIVQADTSVAPASPGSLGSAITYGSGRAVRKAAAEVRDQLLRFAAGKLEIDAGDLDIVDGMVLPVGAPDRARPVAWFARRLGDLGGDEALAEAHARTPGTAEAPSVAAHLARVRVDEETGEVVVLGYVAIQDVGRAIDPALVRGQMTGAAAQAIGLALQERLVHDDQGQLLSGTLMDYALPRAPGLPPIETVIVEVPAPEGPFGARGMAEACIVPGPAAVANAITAATGLRMRELPITPQRLWTEQPAAEAAKA